MSSEARADFDAIVVGSGISGGWAAKELTEQGLKVLLLERGPKVTHRRDYVTEGKATWDLPLRGQIPQEELDRDYPVQKQCYAVDDFTRHFFVKDSQHPYATPQDKPFSWIRGYQLGGRSLSWHRQSYRWSDLDFEANKQDGHGIDWPIRYADLAPWYDHVETFAGISGSIEGLPQLPDGQFQPPMEMNCVEKAIKASVEARFEERNIIIGRSAHLTEPSAEQLALGRGSCQFRNECQRGCSFGAYFSSLSATLPAAERTGNLTTVVDAIVTRVVYDQTSGRASGVRVIDAETREHREYSGRTLFLCASTLGTTQIMLNSTSEHFPNGIGNSSGTLGHYLMDHTSGSGAMGVYPGYEDRYYSGRRPNGIYVPRFRNVNDEDERFLRGFGYQGAAFRTDWRQGPEIEGIGADMKAKLRQPGPWLFRISGFGEMLPNPKNRVWLDARRTDQWGIPLLNIDCEYGKNEQAQLQAMQDDAVEMLEAAGLTEIEGFTEPGAPGIVIHEMGTARMGHDPATSVLNQFNQSHDVPNLFVSDGAAMTSTACQNPSLTYMALTARASATAVQMLKENTL
jgi:choline dehydrogenase-like flavoprotein